ncbi:bifunctional precorrin-2 dehydrogenase/sirohydrochlorin ferrochelatase [bacterium]|nr:bifunctional precorrin-2 dehydrogenase/sirohydrochlorin ferrochelatase [bacterium]
MPKYYPVMLNIEDRPALVVGGGPIAVRKARGLAEYGARVRMVALDFCDEASQVPGVELIESAFRLDHLDHTTIVFAATNDPALHHRIKHECDKRGILCNIVDVPDLCSFIVPSIIRRGELMITISTDGTCPAYSKFQRKRMELCCFPQGAEQMLHVIAAAREELKGPLGKGLTDEQKFELLRSLAESDLVEVLANAGEDEAKAEAVRRIREHAKENKSEDSRE